MARRRAFIFVLATFAISLSAWWTLAGLARSGITSFGQPLFMTLYLLGGFSPTIAAYVSVAKTRDEGTLAEYHSRLVRWRVNPLWFVLAFGLPFALAFAAISMGGRLDPQVLDRIDVKPWSQVVPLFFTMIIGGGLEELGWRGVAQPELERRMSRPAATLLVGLVWALWHFPLFSIAGVGQYQGNFPLFALSTVGLGFILAWIYARTGSILLCIIFHAAANTASAMGLSVPADLTGPALADGVLKLVLGVALVLADRRPQGAEG